ncbi:very short patch repair endonuclease [Pseudolysinimonas yzui]|uniref:very short patch repair endonuclease n=1 Tax=Pseudolysinimonas yzui TaxID=2708254 RepID=UPI00227D8227|nr:very short patch repair endonuclease [Pseudolysinimonas yzui]
MSWATTTGVRRSMLANRRKDTSPELNVRKLLHSRGLRYRVDFAPIGGRRRADIVFTRSKTAIFVDGCYWHGCPEHATLPKSNTDYWLPKLERNVERDRETDALLREAGWTVMRFWEHQAPEAVVQMIVDAVHPSI